MSDSGHTETTGAVPFAEPTPMGLICLAVACAALFPAAFGSSLTPVGLRTASMFCLLFGAGGQFLAGMLSLANRNLFGGTLFTAFAFNWVMNWWTFQQLAAGVVPDHGVVTAVDGCFLVIFVAMTYGFGFASKMLFFFLLDIDLIYVCRLVDALTGTQVLVLPLAVFLVGLAILSLWIAFALLLNPVAGRELFPMGGPMYAPRRPSA